MLRTDSRRLWEARRKAIIRVGVWRKPLAIRDGFAGFFDSNLADFGEGTEAQPTRRWPEIEVSAILAKHLSRLLESFLVGYGHFLSKSSMV